MAAIFTHLHQLDELTDRDEPLVQDMLVKPIYVVSPPVVEILTRSDVQKSIMAMIEADIIRLRYPEMVFEFAISDRARHFVMLQENNGQFDARVSTLFGKHMARIGTHQLHVTVTKDGGVVVTNAEDELTAAAAVFATTIGLLMLNIKGLDRELIDTSALTKARAKRGLPGVPRHSIIRIGVVYDKHGRAHKYDPNAIGTKAPHLRCAYTRRQHHGPENSLTKLVFIPITFVNYQEDDELPQPRAIVKV